MDFAKHFIKSLKWNTVISAFILPIHKFPFLCGARAGGTWFLIALIFCSPQNPNIPNVRFAFLFGFKIKLYKEVSSKHTHTENYILFLTKSLKTLRCYQIKKKINVHTSRVWRVESKIILCAVSFSDFARACTKLYDKKLRIINSIFFVKNLIVSIN